jgi:hypothetical protein
MSRALMAAAVLVSLAVTAGCGGSSSPVATSGPSFSSASSAASTSAAADPATPAATSAAPVAPTTGAYADQSAAQIWQRTAQAMNKTTSVHILANMKTAGSSIELNLRISDQAANGTIDYQGDTIRIIRKGKVVYIKAPPEYFTKAGVAAAKAQTLSKTWIKASSTDKEVARLAGLTGMSFVSSALHLTAAEQKTLKRVPGITISGKPTVGLYDPTGGADGASTLYVTADGTPLPMDLRPKSDPSQYLKFRDWNAPVPAIVPHNPIVT